MTSRVILFFLIVFKGFLLYAGDDFVIKVVPGPKGNSLEIVSGKMITGINPNRNGLVWRNGQKKPITLTGAFPGIRKLDFLPPVIIEDTEKLKVVEHSYLCSLRNEFNFEFVNLYTVQRGLDVAKIESRLLNLSAIKATCYQFWTTSVVPPEKYYTSEGGMHSPPDALQMLDISWIFVPIKNRKDGFGLFSLDKSNKTHFMLNKSRKGQFIVGLKMKNQRQPLYKKGEGSMISFLIFRAETPEKAKVLCDKLSKMKKAGDL